MTMKKRKFTDEYKEEVAKYALSHPEETIEELTSKFDISQSSLSKWKLNYQKSGQIVSRGSGNYASDETKEIARLKKELQDHKDALAILKKAMGIVTK
jgi:transposase